MGLSNLANTSEKVRNALTTFGQQAMNRPAITHYHAHIYYNPARTRGRGERLRVRVAEDFPQAKLGRWHDELVGPHPQSMFQIAFPADMFGAFVPWLMLNRDDLVVLIHPETGDHLTDHTAHAAWFGAVLPLRLEAFGSRKSANK